MNSIKIPVAFDMRDPGRSGIGRVTLSLARAFVQQADPRFEITLCGDMDRLQSLGVRDWSAAQARLVPWAGERHGPRAQLTWNRARRAVGPAIWIFPHWDVPWYALPPRYLVILHDLGLLCLPDATSAWRRILAGLWIRHAARHASRVTVVSEFTRRSLANYMPEVAPKIRLVSNGVNSQVFEQGAPLPSDVANFAAHGPFMLSVGNRKRHKNLTVGVEVLARLPDVRWIVAGKWFAEWDAVMDQAHRRGVASRMLVLDEPPDDVLRGLYHRAACLLFASRYEGFGLPVLEALAAGTPIVSTRVGAAPEILGDCGALCDPDDIEGFVAAIARVIAHPARQSSTCVDRARKFSWNSAATHLTRVLEEVA